MNRSVINQSNRNPSASGTPQNSRVGELGPGSSVINDPQPHEQGRSLGRQSANTTQSASQAELGTTNAGLPRRRIQWTMQMNECVVRLYLSVTRNETIMVNYRQELYRRFVQIYPNLVHLTEQNLADRRSTIYRRNLVPELRRRQIANELNENNSSHERITSQNETSSEVHYNDLPESTVNDELYTTFKNEYCRASTEFQGTSPEYRPKIPKPNKSKQLSSVIDAANRLLSTELANSVVDYPQIDNMLYCMIVAIVRTNGGKVQQRNNRHPGRLPGSKPAWMKRLERKIESLRKDLGVLTSIRSVYKSKRIKNKISKIRRKYATHTRYDPENSTTEEILDTVKQLLSLYSQRLRRYKKALNEKMITEILTRTKKLSTVN